MSNELYEAVKNIGIFLAIVGFAGYMLAWAAKDDPRDRR